MKIALLEPLGVPMQTIDELAAPLKEAGHEFVYFDTKTTDPAELARRSEGAEVVMIANNPYPAEVVAGTDSLKMIAVAFTGIDHVGLSACRERGVEVRNCAGYSDRERGRAYPWPYHRRTAQGWRRRRRRSRR